MERLLAGMGFVGIVASVMLGIALIIFWPFVIIWALNTIFGVGVAYTFWTWLAMLVITATFGKAKLTYNKD